MDGSIFSFTINEGIIHEKDKNDITLSVKVVLNKETAKEEKYKGMSDDELKDIIWNKIKTEVNETVPRYKHITNMIFSKEELVKTTTKKVKRNEEMKKILNNGL